MKVSATHRCASALALLAVAGVSTFMAGQSASTIAPMTYAKPTNLKVLPKDMTAQQVRELMKQWSGSLGVRCDSCHTADSPSIGPGGQLHFDFADDSKPMKATARLMYSMTEEINAKYISKVDGSGVPVTCGSCHRGAVSPEPFEIPDSDGQESIRSGR